MTERYAVYSRNKVMSGFGKRFLVHYTLVGDPETYFEGTYDSKEEAFGAAMRVASDNEDFAECCVVNLQTGRTWDVEYCAWNHPSRTRVYPLPKPD